MAKRKFTKCRRQTHGMHGTPEYQAWANMNSRCVNPTVRNYHSYGGRGIKVCDRWASSFVSFLEDMGKCPPGLTLDRRDNDGNYEPGNCRWATRAEQARNYSRTRLITFNGKTQCITDWAAETGIPFKCLHKRIESLGWSVERALTEPSGTYHTLTWRGESKTARQWGKELNIPFATISARLNRLQWSVEKTLTTPVQRRTHAH